jgi:hypothetical protein
MGTRAEKYRQVAKQKGVPQSQIDLFLDAKPHWTVIETQTKTLQSMPAKTSAKKTTAKKTTKKRKSTSSKKTMGAPLTANQRKDVARVAKLIKDGTIAAQGQVTTYSKASGTTRQKQAAAFIKMYKSKVKAAGLKIAAGEVGLAKKARKVTKKRSTSIAKRYASIAGQKKPYYVAKGRTYRVGGGAGGPGVVRVVPKTGAKTFKSLTADEKKAVAQFLVSPQGKKLRGKGAKRTIVVQQLIKVNLPKTMTKKSTTAKKTSAVTTQQVMRKNVNTIRTQLKAKGYKGKLIGKGITKQKLAAQLAKLS